MSETAILSPHSIIDFTLSPSRFHDPPVPNAYDEKIAWPSSALSHHIPPAQAAADTDSRMGCVEDAAIFPSLPPLLRGHPDVHLRQGVMRADHLTAAHEPDAEKAFFVADLSQVYRQHIRWTSCLPGIQPYYGP